MHKVSAIVPAAGLASRMGGPNKVLLPYWHQTVIGAVCSSLRACHLDVVVVTGRDADSVAYAARPSRAIYNRGYSAGLGSSIAAGVKASPEDNAYLIALGDMPEVDKTVVEHLIAHLVDPSDIVVPVYSTEPNRFGHPVLFGSAYRKALLGLIGDEGARGILQANRARVKTVAIQGGLMDIDTPEDHHALQGRKG